MKDSSVRRWSRIHVGIYRLTRGLLGRRLADNDMLLLTTSGRRSGVPHTVPLLYLRDRNNLVVIASYGGRADHPDWYLNLDSNPEVTIQLNSKVFEAVARTATATERDRWWPRVEQAYEGYEVYQGRTDREIPVVFLQPPHQRQDETR